MIQSIKSNDTSWKKNCTSTNWHNCMAYNLILKILIFHTTSKVVIVICRKAFLAMLYKKLQKNSSKTYLIVTQIYDNEKQTR